MSPLTTGPGADPDNAAAELRSHAEDAVAARSFTDPETLDAGDVARMVHELRVHQVELEMQNEELRAAQQALEASRARFVDLYDFAPAGYVTVNSAGRIVEANHALATLLRVPRGRLLGRLFSTMVLQEDRDRYHYHRACVRASEGSQECELRLAPEGGDPSPAILVSSALTNASGEQIERIIVTDMTERRAAEEVRRSQGALLQVAGRTARFGGWSVDVRTGSMAWSEEVAAMLGAGDGFRPTKDAMLAYFVPECRAAFAARLDACAAIGAAFDDELEITTSRGEPIWVRVTGRALEGANGQAVSIVGSMQDITSRKRAATALYDERMRLQSIVEGTGAGTWEWNVPAGEARFSETWAAIGGYRLQDLEPCGMETRDTLMHPDDVERMRDQLHRHLVGETPMLDGECRVRHRDGSWIWVLDRARVVSRAADGSPGMLYGMRLDVSARRKADAERTSLQSQLLQAQKMEAVGQLAGGIAHDFNNMLTVILGHADLALLREDMASGTATDLVEIRKCAERSAELTRQLLTYASKQVIAPRRTALNDVVTDAIGMLGRLIPEHIAVEWNPGADLPHVHIDPSQVVQVLTNLCVNARDAVTTGGRITITSSLARIDAAGCAGWPGARPGLHVALTVADNGCGMDAATMEHVFEPFFSTKAFGHGTGLGLATVYGIAWQNRGILTVASEPGVGSVFTLLLPAAPTTGAPDAAPDPLPPGGSGGETILLVEDEPRLLKLTARVLHGLGYRVLQAGGASQAIEIVRGHAEPIHLLITDVIMPEMNGCALAERVRELRPDLPCLFMSGYAEDVISDATALQQGARFIAKPFTSRTLGAAIREALGDR